MSFLSDYNSEYLSARITQKGRNAIAKGNFKIDYFQIGDSEFDYNINFTGLTGSTSHQKVFSPFDYNTNVKYPLGYDADLTTTYGTPIQQAEQYTIRNVMGPAGYISGSITGATVSCVTSSLAPSAINGGTSITVSSTGSLYEECDFITLVLGKINNNQVTQNNNSLIYKITGITGNTLYLDRNLPDLSTTSITGTVICNKCELEYPDLESLDPNTLPSPIDTEGQLNSWTLNTVWTTKPIGSDYGSTDESLSGYTSNRYVSTKEFLGYTSDKQIFTNITGGTISGFSSSSYSAGFMNSVGELVEVKPKEQRCVAIIHFSELGDTIADPERFFKYDDYIGHSNDTTDTVAVDYEGDDISDTDYFEVYLPFVYYHRNTGTTYGAYFTMDTTDYYIKPTTGLTESRFELKFRYLLDEQGNKVGKVFVNNKVVVFDDQELVALLDYRSNRKFSLPAPKINIIPSDTSASNSLFSGTTGQTYWVTYMFANVTGSTSPLNYLPCNYFTKVEVNTTADACSISYPSNISLKFGDEFKNMKTSLASMTSGYTAKYMYVLLQSTSANDLPNPNNWKAIPISGLSTTGGYLEPSGITGNSITITKSMYTSGTTFDLEDFMGNDYMGYTGSTTQPQFGDEQPFPGSVKVIRASDVEQMNFLINLPSGKFTKSQNPTFLSGDSNITEIALLDSNKNALVIAKTPHPIKRAGTQVFSIKLDF